MRTIRNTFLYITIFRPIFEIVQNGLGQRANTKKGWLAKSFLFVFSLNQRSRGRGTTAGSEIARLCCKVCRNNFHTNSIKYFFHFKHVFILCARYFVISFKIGESSTFFDFVTFSNSLHDHVWEKGLKSY